MPFSYPTSEEVQKVRIAEDIGIVEAKSIVMKRNLRSAISGAATVEDLRDLMIIMLDNLSYL